jgi:hypothetical protein
VSALRLDGHPGPDLWAGVRAAVRDEGLFAPTTSTAPIVARELQASAPERRAAARVWRAWHLVGRGVRRGRRAGPVDRTRPGRGSDDAEAHERAHVPGGRQRGEPHMPAPVIIVPVSDEGDGVHGLRRLRQARSRCARTRS